MFASLLGGLLGGLGSSLGNNLIGPPVLGGSTSWGAKRRKRRRARLTHSELMELQNIKSIIGKTAAANALPYYLGRGT